MDSPPAFQAWTDFPAGQWLVASGRSVVVDLIDMAPGAQEVLIMQDPGLSYLPLGGDESGGLTADRLLIRLIGVLEGEKKGGGVFNGVEADGGAQAVDEEEKYE